MVGRRGSGGYASAGSFLGKQYVSAELKGGSHLPQFKASSKFMEPCPGRNRFLVLASRRAGTVFHLTLSSSCRDSSLCYDCCVVGAQYMFIDY